MHSTLSPGRDPLLLKVERAPAALPFWPIAVLLLVGIAASYGEVVVSLVQQWSSNDVYAHGFLIPGISAYLVWLRRDRLLSTPIRPNYVGGVLALVLSLLLLVVARRAAVSVVAQLSLIPATGALILLVGGWQILRLLALPLAYLIFMIPIWETVTEPLHYPFQIFSANAGTLIAGAFGVPVFREGTLLMLPTATLEVARECSGVNYLIAIVAIGIPMGWLGLSSVYRRVALVLLALGIAIAANALRVGLIALLSYQGYAGDPHGPAHVFQGLFVAVIGYAALFGGFRLLRTPSPSDPLERQHVPRISAPGPEVRIALAIGALLLFIAGVDEQVRAARATPPGQQLSSLSNSLGDWSGAAVARPSTQGVPEADHTLVRRYTNSRADAVVLEISYFESQRQGKELVSYRTKALENDAQPVEVALADGTISIMEKLEERPVRQLVSYWYDLSGRHATNRFEVKLATALESLVNRRTSGARVMVTVPLRPGDPLETARAHRDQFIGAAWPSLQALLTANEDE
jgi:EpsI family protein